MEFRVTRAPAPSTSVFYNPEEDDPFFNPPPRPRREPQLQQPMMVSFSISKKALRDDFKRCPELVAELEQFTYKRYLAYVGGSFIFDPKDRWDGPNPPPYAPPENIELCLIGAQPPSLEYFPDFVKVLHPGGVSGMCRTITTTSQEAEETANANADEQARPAYRIEGPPLCRRKLETAYLYTSHTFHAMAVSVTLPNKSADGTGGTWEILHNGECLRFEQYYDEAEDKVFRMWKEYRKQRYPDEPIPGLTLEDGKQLYDGIDRNLRLADYKVPVDVFLDVDDQEEIEDPCDFKKEVTDIRRTLYKYHEALEDFDPHADRGDEIPDSASEVRDSGPPPKELELREIPNLAELAAVMQGSSKTDVLTEPIIRRSLVDTSFQIGLTTGFLLGLSTAYLVFACMSKKISLR